MELIEGVLGRALRFAWSFLQQRQSLQRALTTIYDAFIPHAYLLLQDGCLTLVNQPPGFLKNHCPLRIALLLLCFLSPTLDQIGVFRETYHLSRAESVLAGTRWLRA